MSPRTRGMTAAAVPKLLGLPDNCLALILLHACDGEPFKQRRCLAEVCRTFRSLFGQVAFSGRSMLLNLQALSLQLVQARRRAAARRQLVAAVSAVAPSVRTLQLRYQLEPAAGLALEQLLAPLAPHVRRLEVEDGLYGVLLATLGGGTWAALEEVAFTGCSPWMDLEPTEVARLERQLADLPPGTRHAISEFEGSCQGMQEGGESFFKHLSGLRCLELEDWAGWDLPLDWGPLRAMPHLSRLVLSGVESLDSALPELQSLTQVRELALLGCIGASPGLSTLTNLAMLDMQMAGIALEDEAAADAVEAAAAAAWRCRQLTELRWCGNLVFGDGESPVDLPHLVSLEIDDAWLPSGLPPLLCTSLTHLTSLRLVSGHCARLPAAISALTCLQVLAIDSLYPMPAIPPSISALQSVTNLQLANVGLGPQLPVWMLSLPVEMLWLAHNKLTRLFPDKGARAAHMSAPAYKERCAAFLGRLTHLTLSSNDFSELPAQLLLHATALRELDLAYNRQLQMSAEAADAVAEMGSLQLLRLEKPYWLLPAERWTPASLRALARLQKQRPALKAEYQQFSTGVRFAW